MRLPALGALLVAAVLALTGCAPVATVTRVDGDESPFQGVYLDDPYTLPDATLTDSAGQPYDLRSGSDRPVLVTYFGYTNCTDICIGTLTDIATALNRLDASVRDRIQVLFVTVDPDRDTPQVMRDYLARIDPDFIGLTAPFEQIQAIAAPLGIALDGTEPLEDGGYDVSHSTQMIGFDADRLGRLVWVQGTSIGTLREDLTELVRQQG